MANQPGGCGADAAVVANDMIDDDDDDDDDDEKLRAANNTMSVWDAFQESVANNIALSRVQLVHATVPYNNVDAATKSLSMVELERKCKIPIC